MKLKVLMTGLTLTAATLMGTTAAQAHDVEYRGDIRAREICRAIVEDNPREVSAQLSKASRELRGVAFTRATEENFRCNGQSLSAFAEDTGARRALSYLEGASVERAVATQ